MELAPYVDSLRTELLASAENAPEDVRTAAERLARTLDPATRIVLLEALAQAAAEITTLVPSGSVDVRLRGREVVDFVVDVPPPAPAEGAPAYAAPTSVGDDDATDEGDEDVVRITLRLPEGVKRRADELAAKTGRSLNAWIVTALRAATSERGATFTVDLGSIPFMGPGRGSHRMSGWV